MESQSFPYQRLVLGAAALSIAVLLGTFHYHLTTTTKGFAKSFRAEHAKELAAGDSLALCSRLDALAASLNWVCITAQRDGDVFFQREKGYCGNTFFQRQVNVTSPGSSGLSVSFTLRLPGTLELGLGLSVCIQIFCLAFIYILTKKTEDDRRLAALAREEERRLEQAKVAARLATLASQVHHDIQSPLASLAGTLEDLPELPESKRSVLRSAITRITDIANNLRERHTATHAPDTSLPLKHSLHLLSSLVASLVSEKRTEFRAKRGISVDAALDSAAYGLFVSVDPPSFKRILSNLINNAVEAVGDTGTVKLSMARAGSLNLLSVRDDGKGIAAEILPRLGRRGATFGKENGSGLGLYHARTSLEQWGGSLQITSDGPGHGAVVTLRLPAASPPPWFVSKILLRPHSVVVILDDEQPIHDLWRARFRDLDLGIQNIEVIDHFTSSEAEKWIQANRAAAESALFLTDYELLGHEDTGLGFVSRLDVSSHSILVSTRCEEPVILRECERLGMKMLPKALAGLVPIEVLAGPPPKVPGRVDAVLLDDDDSLRELWRGSAAKAGKLLRTFALADELLASLDQFDKTLPIYIDSDLGDAQRPGEEIAKELFERGFTHLYLATGFAPDELQPMPWLKGVVGKRAPWGAAARRAS